MKRVTDTTICNWQEFASSAPMIAKFGEDRIGSQKVMYLATITPGGNPRLHPFCPFLGAGHFFAVMEPQSPKAKDLQLNHKYAIHSLVKDPVGIHFDIT